LSTTNPTWPKSGSNSGRRCGKPATNRLSYGAAHKHPCFWVGFEPTMPAFERVKTFHALNPRPQWSARYSYTGGKFKYVPTDLLFRTFADTTFCVEGCFRRKFSVWYTTFLWATLVR
jgi:hypothetical protein